MNVLQMCRVLTGAGYRVDLATYPIGETVEMEGLEIHRCLRPPGIRSVPVGFSKRKIILDFFLFWTILGLLLRRRYRVLHAVEESVFLALPFTLFGSRLVYDLDSLISDQLEYTGVLRSPRLLGTVRALERLALRRSTAAITVCQSLTEAALELDPGARVFQVEDSPLDESLRPADPARVEELRSELELEGLRPIVYTGNLESYQGIDLLIESAPLVLERFPNARFVVVGGSGSRLSKLREELASEGLEATVLPVGQRPPAEMPEWMALAEVLVSPRSEGDNTPLKIYTYMHAERPIAATDRVTHTQVLNGSNAFLGAATVAGMAGAIQAALEDPAEAGRRATAAHRTATTEYSFAAFERKLVAAYSEILRQ
jgi:glycosyltransferase involved in cell wall biosynthesis